MTGRRMPNRRQVDKTTPTVDTSDQNIDFPIHEVTVSVDEGTGKSLHIGIDN